MPRKTKRIVPTAFYLGEADLRKRREIALNELAAKMSKDLDIKNRSQLLQAIADGEIELIPRRPKTA